MIYVTNARIQEILAKQIDGETLSDDDREDVARWLRQYHQDAPIMLRISPLQAEEVV